MTFIQLIFYLFATVAVVSGLVVILSNNPVRSVLSLILAFFATAGVWVLLHAEFLALILVVVYVGAVMTLFLFVVMMLNVHWVRDQGFVRYLPFVATIVLLVLALTVLVVGPKQFGIHMVPQPEPLPADFNNVGEIGKVLYTHYVYPFEIAAVILLTAIIAAISLTHQKVKNRKMQDPAAQVAVRKEDRVRLIRLDSEKKQKGQ